MVRATAGGRLLTMGIVMRSVQLALLLGALAVGSTVASTAEAQMGRKRGNQDQQQKGDIKPIPKEEKRFPLGQSWIAVSLNGKSFGGAERPAFALDEQFRARGFGGCNSFSATAFPLREQGFAVGPLALTKRTCDGGVMASEKAFLTALRTAAKWDTTTGSLIIKGPNGEIRFERAL
jgi:heat shock protein HslJ